ncbi:hypothetical protein Pcinc_036901 [Petrolisthes cinctipes]|uniref:Uncharacterized protein n=1 Tax=Petrolisthes cinctipes TaxID=88211 RepID=A0AAE1ELI3_PETCI|nr:hypothetical protein Pcinc_036901 [Petrolisthes cinctipes]
MVDCTDECIQCLVPVRARQEGLQCDMCVDDPATPAMEHEPHIPAVEQESSIDDPPDLPMELEESLDDPAIHNNELLPESDITFQQLFAKGTQCGRDKLVDSHGYTYNNKNAAIECNLLAVYCPS